MFSGVLANVFLLVLSQGYHGRGSVGEEDGADLSPRVVHSGLSTMNRCHVVVTNGGRVTVVPIYRDAAPGRTSDRALIFHVVLPENSVS